MDQNLPFGCGANQERTGRAGSNLPQFENILSPTWNVARLPAPSMLGYEREKQFFVITGGCSENDLIVWVWLLFFFSFPGWKNNISGTKRGCKRDVCCVWFHRRLRKDSLSLVVWLWGETSESHFFLLFSCWNTTFLFILIFVGMKNDMLTSLQKTLSGCFPPDC